jgi:hypothetical protein
MCGCEYGCEEKQIEDARERARAEAGVNFVYKKNQMSTDRESGRGNKRAEAGG